MHLQNQITPILFVVVAITSLALPCLAVPPSAQSSGHTQQQPDTILDTLDAKPVAPQTYQTINSLGLSKQTRSTAPIDPKHPTWQNYYDAAHAARLAGKPEMAVKYHQAALFTLEKTVQANPTKKLKPRDDMLAKVMCGHQMCVDGRAILKSGDSLSKMSAAKELEQIAEEQNKNFSSMRTAYATLKTLSPVAAHRLAFELTKCTAVMAKTKDRLEKARSEAMSPAKTQ